MDAMSLINVPESYKKRVFDDENIAAFMLNSKDSIVFVIVTYEEDLVDFDVIIFVDTDINENYDNILLTIPVNEKTILAENLNYSVAVGIIGSKELFTIKDAYINVDDGVLTFKLDNIVLMSSSERKILKYSVLPLMISNFKRNLVADNRKIYRRILSLVNAYH